MSKLPPTIIKNLTRKHGLQNADGDAADSLDDEKLGRLGDEQEAQDLLHVQHRGCALLNRLIEEKSIHLFHCMHRTLQI